MDRLRHCYVRRQDDDIELEELPAPDGAEADVEVDLVALDVALAKLSLLDREALTLFYLRELSIDEIAALLELPIGTVKSRLFRARRALRNELLKTGALS